MPTDLPARDDPKPAPLVTVGVALYNHERYIETCLRSLLRQTYPNLQIIVIDDGSKDRSHEIARQYLDTHGAQRDCTLITRENRGMCNTLNEIAKLARGAYISFIGSDDYWMPNKIAEQVAFLEAHPECVLVHSNSIKVDAEGKPLKKLDYSKKINSGNVFAALAQRTGGINTPSHLYRTSVYADIGYYDPAFSFEDTDFWLRLTREHQVGFINAYHTCYRWHGSNLSHGRNALRFYHDELIQIYRKNIEDGRLRRQAIRKVHLKSLAKSLKAGRVTDAWRFLVEYLNPEKTPPAKNRAYYAGARQELFPFCPRECRKVLDVGCGVGNFGKSIKDAYKAEVWGLDVSADAILVAERNLDKAIRADIAADPHLLPDRYFDTIFFNDVLEHLADPHALLRHIASKLAPNGIVIASIPNIRYHKVLYDILVRKDFRYLDAGVMDNTHLRFFTRKSMARMFESAGYRVLDVTPINRSKSMKPVLYKILTLGLIGGDICYPQFVVRAARP